MSTAAAPACARSRNAQRHDLDRDEKIDRLHDKGDGVLYGPRARMASVPTDYSAHRSMQINVVEYLEREVLVTCPHKTAIIDGANRYTFADLERYAKRCASLLIKRRDGTSAPIAVFLPKGRPRSSPIRGSSTAATPTATWM
jgi:hypothetical protein